MSFYSRDRSYRDRERDHSDHRDNYRPYPPPSSRHRYHERDNGHSHRQSARPSYSNSVKSKGRDNGHNHVQSACPSSSNSVKSKVDLKYVQVMRTLLNEETSLRKDLVEALPDELLLQLSSDGCSLCSAELNEVNVWTVHYESYNHHRKLQRWAKNFYTEKKLPMPPAIEFKEIPLKHRDEICELCIQEFSSPAEAEEHYGGKMHHLVVMQERMVKDPDLLVAPEGVHRAVLLRQREMRTVFLRGQNNFHCDICYVDVQTESQLKQHLLGAAHRKRAKMFTETQGKDLNPGPSSSNTAAPDDDTVEDFSIEDMDLIVSQCYKK